MSVLRKATWPQIERTLGSGRLARLEFRPDRNRPVGLSNPRFLLSNIEVQVRAKSEVSLVSKADPVEVRFTDADEVDHTVEIDSGKTLLFDAEARVIGFRLNEPFGLELELRVPNDWSYARKLIDCGEPVKQELARMLAIGSDPVPAVIVKASDARVKGRSGAKRKYFWARDTAVRLLYQHGRRLAEAKSSRTPRHSAIEHVERNLKVQLGRKLIEQIVDAST